MLADNSTLKKYNTRRTSTQGSIEENLYANGQPISTVLFRLLSHVQSDCDTSYHPEVPLLERNQDKRGIQLGNLDHNNFLHSTRVKIFIPAIKKILVKQ